MATITIHIPPDVLKAWTRSPETFSRDMRLEAALQLWQGGDVSLGKAAELAGVSQARLLDLIAERKMEWPMDDEDLKQELAFAESPDPGRVADHPSGHGGPDRSPDAAGSDGGDPG